MNLLAAENIGVVRGGRAILNTVSFAADAGEFVAVIGPNGAGKSTLLSALAGLLTPDTGKVLLDGAAITTIPLQQLARRRAYLPQNPVCEWPITVERLVALGLSAHLPMFGGLPPSFDAAITRALEACDLTQRRAQPVTTLSGGELSRAMLARAMVGEPDILIVDEPVTGLDPAHAMDCARRLSLYAQGGRLVIASLHDLTLAARHAHRIVALKDGAVAGEGMTSDILTPVLIRQVFAVEGRISGMGDQASVELHPSAI